MSLKIGSTVCYNGISGGMALIECIFCKTRHFIEKIICIFFVNEILFRPFNESDSFRFEQLAFLL